MGHRVEDLTDEDLVAIAEVDYGGFKDAQTLAEMGRRQLAASRELRQAILDLRSATDSSTRWLIALTVALVLFTLVIGALTAVVALKGA